MITAPDTRTARERLEEHQGRTRDLESRHAQKRAAQLDAERELQRLAADDAPEREQQKVSDRIGLLSRQQTALARQLQDLEAELPTLQEASWQEQIAELRAADDAATEAYRQALEAEEDALLRLGAAFLPVRRAVEAASQRAREARMERMRAEGADNYAIYHLELLPWSQLPEARQDRDWHVTYSHLLPLLLSYGRKAEALGITAAAEEAPIAAAAD